MIGEMVSRSFVMKKKISLDNNVKIMGFLLRSIQNKHFPVVICKMCYLTHDINTILQWNIITDSFRFVFLYVGEKERLQSNQGNSSLTPEDYTKNKSHGNLN